MKKLLGLILAGCIGSVCQAQALLHTPAQPPDAPNALVLLIEPAIPADGTEYSPSAIHIILRNVSSKTVVFEDHYPENQLAAFILDSENHSIGLSAATRQRLIPKSNVVTIGDGGGPAQILPREETSRTWNLGRTYDLSKPGKYRVRVTGTFREGQPPLSSNTIELIVAASSQ